MNAIDGERGGRSPQWSFCKKVTIFVLGLLLSGSIAWATDAEVAPYFSYRVGGLELPATFACPLPLDRCQRIETEDGVAWGLGFGLELSEGWWMELRFSNQIAEFENALSSATTEASWDRYLVGMEYRWIGSRRWSPFIALAGGWTDLSAEFDPQNSGADLTHPTLEFGLGILFDRSERLGLRLEMRTSWTGLPSGLGTDLLQVGLGLGFRLRSASR